MDQYESIRNLIADMAGYLISGKMVCEQVPYADVLFYLEKEYERVNIDGSEIVRQYEENIKHCINLGDSIGLGMVLMNLLSISATLEIICSERDVREEMYERISKAELYYYRNYVKNDRLKNPEPANPAFKGRGAVYTAITGAYDSVRIPEYVDNGLDYYLFTDNDAVTSDFYHVIHLKNEENLDPVKLSKKIKIIGNWEYLKEYDFTVWADGNLQIIGDIREYILTYSKGAPLLCFNHHERDDLYSEGEICKERGLDDSDVIINQLNRYREEGFPEHAGLIAACFLVKDNGNALLRDTMYDWWEEIKNGSKRDQLSFSYSCWKNGLLYDTSPYICFYNNYIKLFKHDKN